MIRAIRDYFNHDIGDILIDTDDVFEQAQQFMAHVMPEHAARVKRYRDDAALFSRFQIEHQIESAYARTVNLPSGGAIVIDHTEALVSIDVNSARAIKGGDIEETATRTNLEAADEVARQMRLRDLGGLIVIDVIDMEESKNRREVENRLRDALRQDRARVQFGTISKFGLMEMSRQRLKPALSEGSSIPCPRCGGSGHIRDTESSALQILRIIQEESMKDNTASVLCQVPVEVASFLLNEKRTEIAKIELKQRINVLMVPNKTLETPNYRLERLKHDDPRLDQIQASYKMAEEVEDPTAVTRRSQEPTNKQTPVIKGVLPDAPAPVAAPRAEAPAAPRAASSAPAPANRTASPAAKAATVAVAAPVAVGFMGWLKSLFGAAPAPAPAPVAPAPAAAARKDDKPEGRSGGRDGQRDGQRGDGRRGGRNDRNDRGGERSETRGNRDGEARAPRPEGDARPPREPREGDNRNRRGGRDGEQRGERSDTRNANTQGRDGETRPPRDGAEGRDNRGGRNEPREVREPRETREPREPRADRPEGERREPREPRDGRAERAPRERREVDAHNATETVATTAQLAGTEGTLDAENDAQRSDRAPRNGERGDGAEGGRRERGRRGGRGPRNTEAGVDAQGNPVDDSRAPAHADSASAADGDAGERTGDAPGQRADAPEGEDRPRRSRDRYGRDRRERGDRPPRDGAQPERDGDTAALAETAEAPAQPSYFAAFQNAAPAASVAPVVAAAAAATAVAAVAVASRAEAPVAAAPAPAPAPAAAVAVAPVPTPVPAPAPVAAPVAPVATGLPKVEAFALPLNELQQVAESSGLQWVNSDAAKFAAVQAAIAAEPRPVHVPRERPPVVVVNEGPLVLVETQRDLRDLKLPFEQVAPAPAQQTLL